ncbi:MAG: hypothetical protein IIB62_08390 [Proteobacteria bacterium]|nr:hypothetical protein [Pseudomonadota bacterium]
MPDEDAKRVLLGRVVGARGLNGEVRIKPSPRTRAPSPITGRWKTKRARENLKSRNYRW